jgi:tRNA G18 (ribose-2'-O)-methylase SpoU
MHHLGLSTQNCCILLFFMNNKLKLWELGRVNQSDYKAQAKFPFLLILDNIRSLNNVGAFFRTADALNVKKIYLCGITACPPHREIHKTALGATDTVEWEYFASAFELCEQLKTQGIKICAVEQAENKTFLNKFAVQNDEIAFVFGNEVEGVQQSIIDLCDEVLEIPQFGTKHSFNVAVSAGIVLWEAVRQLLEKE